MAVLADNNKRTNDPAITHAKCVFSRTIKFQGSQLHKCLHNAAFSQTLLVHAIYQD